MRISSAYSLLEIDPLEGMIEKVTFWRVEQGLPVEGSSNVPTTSGKQFNAEWGDQMILCGSEIKFSLRAD